MMHAIDRARRGALAAGLVGAFVLLPLGAMAADGASPPTSRATPPNAAAPAPGAPAAAQRDPEVERRIVDLHKKLKITPAQQPQFDAMAEVMRANAQAMRAKAEQSQQNRAMNAIEDLRAYQEFTEMHAEALKRMIPAFQSLYDSLNDQQKHVADAVLGHAAERAQQRQARPNG